MSARASSEVSVAVAEFVLGLCGPRKRADALAALVGAIAIVVIGSSRTRAEEAGLLTSLGKQLAELAAEQLRRHESAAAARGLPS